MVSKKDASSKVQGSCSSEHTDSDTLLVPHVQRFKTLDEDTMSNECYKVTSTVSLVNAWEVFS